MVAIDIVAGFLGSGKTTFIGHMLDWAPRSKRIVILENEFGKAGIDGAVLRQRNIPLLELSSGCICCSLSGSFVEGILQAIKQYSPDRIIIEPTGIARLSDVMKALADESLRHQIHIDSSILLLDGDHFFKIYSRFEGLMEDAICSASHICVSKTQGKDAQTLDRIAETVKQMRPDAVVHVKPWENIDVWQLCHEDGLHQEHRAKNHAGDQSYETLQLPSGREGQLEDVLHVLSNPSEFGEFVRAKGYAKSTQGVWQRIDHVYGDTAIMDCDDPPIQQIQLIGLGLRRQEILMHLI